MVIVFVGKQKIGARFTIICYYLLGLPVTIFLLFYKGTNYQSNAKLGVLLIWICLEAAQLINLSASIIYFSCFANWVQAIWESKSRIERNKMSLSMQQKTEMNTQKIGKKQKNQKIKRFQKNNLKSQTNYQPLTEETYVVGDL